MSWAHGSQSWAGEENTPSPNLTKSLMRVQGLRESLGNMPAKSQLFPSDILKSRLNSALETSTEMSNCAPSQHAPAEMMSNSTHKNNMQLVRSSQPEVRIPSPGYSQALSETEDHLSQHPSVKADSQGTNDFEGSSVGTWNSSKEKALSSASTDVQGAPLPAPLHIIEAIGSMSVTNRRPSFSTTSLALSGCPVLPGDEKENQPLNAAGVPATFEDNIEQVDPNALAMAAAAVDHWDIHKQNYPKVHVITLDRYSRIDECDIDTVTGKLLKPVRYIKLQRDSSAKHNWRRMNLTSGNCIDREIARRKELRKEIERREHEAKYANPTFEEDKVPDAACTIRPAKPEDFPAIADIIDLERKRGEDSQVYLPKAGRGPAGLIVLIRGLYDYCLSNHRPFIVAVPSTSPIKDRTNWSKEDEEEYQEFLKFKQSRQTSKQKVLGFAVITEARIGFLAPCNGSRFSGLIRLFVHPQHRQKKVGTALLDKILSCVNIYHRSEIDYKWDCSDTRKTYEYVSAHNLRKYNRVYVQAYSAGKSDAQVDIFQRLLNKFDFELVAQFQDAVKHGIDPGVWKTLNVWELEVRSPSEIQEDLVDQ
ncbi:unnamed protein product [Fusarium equiseti]|uniref:Uncharacterized protein n=1 Tax=Fusarium equiseti TaxID=61235 RepID=A0A8J2NCE1_FUSEQ|nr:unnamed protein product [Fusarium equiseti]